MTWTGETSVTWRGGGDLSDVKKGVGLQRRGGGGGGGAQ